MADVPQIGGGGETRVPTTDTGTPSTLSTVSMAKRAMRVTGTQSDKTILREALEAVQDAIHIINMKASFDFTITKDTDIPLVEDQRAYDIPDQAFALKDCVLVRDSVTPEEILPLGRIDWGQFHEMFHQIDSGMPTFWMARDVYIDRKVYLAVPPDGSTAGEWKLRIYYRTAVDNPPLNDENVAITAPVQLSTVIIRYAEYRLLTLHGDVNDSRMRNAYSEFRDLLNSFRGMENRSRPGVEQIRAPFYQRGSSGRRFPFRRG